MVGAMIELATKLVTAFHRSLATPEWLNALAGCVEKRIAEHPEFWSSDGKGVVASQYNEDRYMGPRSACKYEFAVTVNVDRPRAVIKQKRKELGDSMVLFRGRPRPSYTWFGEGMGIAVVPAARGKDRYEAGWRYLPKSEAFETRFENIITKELTAWDRKRYKEMKRIAGTVTEGLSLATFEAMRCPYCGCSLEISFHPSGKVFSLGCSNQECLVGIYGEPKHLPDWWSQKTGGWLDEADPPPRS
jgi:hypothetical protein